MKIGETAHVELGYRPRRWQEEARRSLRRFSVLIIHRRAGKTLLAIVTLVDSALRTAKTSARYAYVAPFRGQAKAVAWDYLKAYANKVPGTEVNESELHVTFPNGSQIRLYGADNPDALRGLYLDGLVIDEVADMKPGAWEEVMRPALADRRGWALFIGTPKGVNALSIMFHRAQRDPEWRASLLTIHDTDHGMDDAEIASMRASMSEAQFRQEMLCDFNASSDDQLITLDQALTSQRRAPAIEAFSFAPKIVGVDVARYGDDDSAICRRQGVMCWPIEMIHGMDNMTLAGRVATVCSEYDPDAVFVDAGRGEGVIDRLRQLGIRAIEVNFGGTPGAHGFRNKRAEMAALAAEWVRESGALPAEPQGLIQEMCSIKYSYANAANVMELESKDALKARGLPSPNAFDSLCLTFAMPVAPRSDPLRDRLDMRPRKAQLARSDNPWAEM